jgi:hypothetical protein
MKHDDEIRNRIKLLVGKCHVWMPLGRPESNWKDNIKIDPK